MKPKGSSQTARVRQRGIYKNAYIVHAQNEGIYFELTLRFFRDFCDGNVGIKGLFRL